MNYFEDKPCEKACMILMKAAHDSIALIEKGKYKRAELVLQCALEDASDLIEGKKAAADTAALKGD